MECLFCKIGKRQVEAEIIYEDGATMAFLDIHPLTLGHAMVIPKDHAVHLLDLPDNQIHPTFLAVKRVTEMLNRAFNPRGFTIGINHGRISGQTIDHLHVHIIPRYEGDGGGSIHSVVKSPPEESLEETRKKIVEASR